MYLYRRQESEWSSVLPAGESGEAETREALGGWEDTTGKISWEKEARGTVLNFIFCRIFVADLDISNLS